MGNINGKKRRVLSGVDFGEETRKLLDLDSIDNTDETVTFLIPDHVYSVNSSFFSGLFQISLKKFGEAKFREKYLFECDDIIRLNIEMGIFNIVSTLNLLEEDK